MTPSKEHLDYPIWSWIECIDAYVVPHDQEDYLPCCRCKLKPKIWVFDNGRYTACGCWESQYRHWSICAESISSFYKANKTTEGYSQNDLKNNWNHYQLTGEILFDRPKGGREDGRW